MDNHNIKSKTSHRQALEEKHINAEKLTNERSNNNTTYNNSSSSNNNNNNSINTEKLLLRIEKCKV
jgi:hypothetical protein